MKAAVHRWLRAQPKTFFADRIKKLVGHWEKCIAKRGVYVEKRCNLLLKFLINRVKKKKCGNFLKNLRIIDNMSENMSSYLHGYCIAVECKI